jgi:hypothetical protein
VPKRYHHVQFAMDPETGRATLAYWVDLGIGQGGGQKVRLSGLSEEDQVTQAVHDLIVAIMSKTVRPGLEDGEF